jgi:hypothetical protein
MLLAPGVVASGATTRREVRAPLPRRVMVGVLGSPAMRGLALAAAYVQVAQSRLPVRETPLGSVRLPANVSLPQT